jgi:(4-O-methyl)-D-glucuronate---lignin esterase
MLRDVTRTRNGMVRILAFAGLLGLASSGLGQVSDDELERGFKQPPESAKPRVWWHWMSGNVTKEGITADLEWMKRVGIAGMQMFDGSLGIPQFTEKRLVWMTPEWKDAFRHAAAEADRLGLEMSMAASGGWSETAGPWVKPEQAMKKVVWSETRLKGPRAFAGALPNPPSLNGRFQNIPVPRGFDIPEMTDLPGAKPAQKAPPAPPDPTYYADVAVLAYRVPNDEVKMADLPPKVTASAGGIDTAALMDGDFGKTVALPLAEGAKNAWIQFEFTQPFRAQAFSIAVGSSGIFGSALPDGEVQASEDGAKWVTLVTLPGPKHQFGGLPVRTYSFPETTVKFYRVLFFPAPPNPILAMFGMGPTRQFNIAEIELVSGPRVNLFEDKASFGTLIEPYSAATPAVPENQRITLGNVIDLTSRMHKDGTLDWDVPAGNWIVLRMGYSLTGEKNHPATPEATGYEVDKLSRKHVDAYVENYVGQVSKALGPYFGKSFRYFLMDSWEAGQENWTDDMLAEFRKRRGYDATRYLPALSGRVVESADVSDRFLWDFRRTIADLLAENHYHAATEYFHKHGVGLYAEAMGAGLPTTGDGLLNKGQVDVPMGEFWTPLPGQSDTPEHATDVREAASAAHIYGKRIAATESFTSMPFIPGWGQSPFYLKPLGDRYLAMGVNRIIFHTSDHQPFVDESHKPGITLWMFGQHYTRNITWAEQAVAWNTYLARCSYLLQQGLYAGDVAYFYGEGAPVTVPFWKEVNPVPPAGYSHDYMNADVLMNRLSVKDGRLVLPDGMSYRVLVLPEDVDQLTLPVLHKIRDLVAAGATILAPRPVKSPSLVDYPVADREVRNIATEVWGAVDGKTVTEHEYGNGKVYWGKTVQEVLQAGKTAPDFEYNRPKIDTELVWIHRQAADTDLYFVANQKERTEDIDASFRIDGKQAELWHPDTGSIEPAEYKIDNGRTTVRLHLDPDGSLFVVFRGKAPAPSRTLPHPVSSELAAIRGPWRVSFPPNWGAPPEIHLESLISWTASTDDGVKYFSGTAAYAKEVEAPQDWFRSGAKVVLDLGKVKEIAEVSVNGKPVGGILWKPPFQADVTEVLKPGSNRIEIKVTNLWPNRIIGDQQPSAKKKYTFTDYRPYTKDSPLLESGLLGPVMISSVTVK